MTEACAVANYLSYNINSTNELTFCFDVGGSTTDISVICKDNVASKMLKQNSIRLQPREYLRQRNLWSRSLRRH